MRQIVKRGQCFGRLQRKTRRRVIIDYNPTAPFWAHTNLIDGGEKQFAGKWKMYITDHRHNPFLSEDDHAMYENISDPDLFNVYLKGYDWKDKGLILGHFKEVDKIPQCDRYVWGIDYGYTNDPTAIVKWALLAGKDISKRYAMNRDWVLRISNVCS